MGNFGVFALFFALSLDACAAALDDLDGTDQADEETSVGDGGVKRDGGFTACTNFVCVK